MHAPGVHLSQDRGAVAASAAGGVALAAQRLSLSGLVADRCPASGVITSVYPSV